MMMAAGERHRARRPRKTEMEKIRLFEKPAGVRRLVAIKEAARYSHISRSRIYQLLAANRIKAYKDGHRTMVDLNSIDDYQNSLPELLLR
jgi:excisionase family DNA binding protein